MSEASRSINSPAAENCDGYIPIGPDANGPKRVVTSPSWKGPGWYKFAYYARMATSPPPYNRCGTHATGYMIHSHPTEIGKTKNVKFCFNWDSSCRWSTYGSVTRCGKGNNFVYKLSNVPNCTNRYCAVP